MKQYSEKFDAYYDDETNEWLDTKCDDPNCEYCVDRPDTPNPVLGYAETERGWEPIVQPSGRIYTQAFILCKKCRAAISGHGGPRYNSLCLECFNGMSDVQPQG